MKAKISDLNMHLFAQLERLGDENLTTDRLKLENERSKNIVMVSEQIIDAAKITLDAFKLIRHGEFTKIDLPVMFLDANDVKLIGA